MRLTREVAAVAGGDELAASKPGCLDVLESRVRRGLNLRNTSINLARA